MTIYVVLFWTSTIILELRESSRHLQLQTESEQIGNLNLLVGSHLLGNIHLAHSTDVIAEHQLSFHFRHIEESSQHHIVLTHIFVERLQIHLRVLPYSHLLLQRCSIVIIGWSTPEFRSHTLTELQHRFTIYIEIIYHTRLLAYGNRHSLCADLHIRVGFLHLHTACLLHLTLLGWRSSNSRNRRFGKLIIADDKLLASHHLALVYQRLCAIACKSKVKNNLLLCMLRFSLSHRILQFITLDQFGSLRSNTLCFRNLNCSQFHTIGINRSYQVQVIDILEEVLVVNLESTIHSIQVLDPYILMIVLNLVSMRIQTAVWSNDTITVEVIVTCRIAAVISTISKDFLTGDRTLVTNALIYEVPDIATLILRILTDEVPIFLETTFRITHSMSIFALDVWFNTITLAIFLTLLVVDIHRTVNISLAVITATLILNRTGLVERFHPVIGFFEVDAVTTLITQTPYDDRRVIDKTFHITFIAFDVSLEILRELSE